jgi:hypothetical protein
LCLAFWVTGSTAALWADGIQATLNRTEASVEDQLLLTLTVEGSRSADPTLPDLSDFDVHSRGQSTQMSFINGRVTSSVGYNYVLIPKRTGTITIGAATVELDGQVYSSAPIEVRIVGAEEKPEQTRDLFLSAKVSTTQPFVGQEVVYIWRFYRRVRIGDARLEPQDFAGFLVEDLGEVREYQATVNGVQYLVSEIRKALFPQEAGTQRVPASRLTLEVLVRRNRRGPDSMFDDFFGRSTTETKVLRSQEIELEVQPLPDPPVGFSGLVGEFEIQAQISKAALQVGESTTLELTVTGKGNVQMITEPTLPELPDFKIYDDKPSGSVERSGARLTGARTFSKALVPLRPGELVVSPVRLTYFDPEAGEFQEIQTAAIPLTVVPGQGKEDLNLTESLGPTTGKVAVRILADDLLPIYKGLDAARPSWVRSSDSWVFWAGLLLPALVFAATFLSQRRRERFALDTSLRRRHHALRQLRKGLRSVESPESASLCLRQYIGDKLGLEGSALTPTEVDAQLRGRGVAEDVAAATHSLLDRLEAAQFGGNSVQSSEAVREIESLVKSLERQIR